MSSDFMFRFTSVILGLKKTVSVKQIVVLSTGDIDHARSAGAFDMVLKFILYLDEV